MEFYNKIVTVEILNVEAVSDEINCIYQNILRHDPKLRQVIQVAQTFVAELPDWMQKSLMITTEVGERRIIFKTSRSQDDKFVIKLDSGDSDEISMRHVAESGAWRRQRDFWPKVGLLGVFILAIAGGLASGGLAYLGVGAAMTVAPAAVAQYQVTITVVATAGIGAAGVYTAGSLTYKFDANSFIANGRQRLSIAN